MEEPGTTDKLRLKRSPWTGDREACPHEDLNVLSDTVYNSQTQDITQMSIVVKT